MNKHAWWAWAIKNSVVLICGTVLAVVFEKWWLAVLFPALFMNFLDKKEDA